MREEQDRPDWTIMVKHKYPESACTCACGRTFRSHARFFAAPEGPRLVSRKPCPGCGKDDVLMRISSDPELYTLRGDKL